MVKMMVIVVVVVVVVVVLEVVVLVVVVVVEVVLMEMILCEEKLGIRIPEPFPPGRFGCSRSGLISRSHKGS